MRIQVLTGYRGKRTGEQWIAPGVYEVGDPALYGLEDYLVTVQRKAIYLDAAARMDAPSLATETVRMNAEDAPFDFSALDDDDLRARAYDAAVLPPGDVTREELIERLRSLPPLRTDDLDNETVSALRVEAVRLGIDLRALKGTGRNGNLVKDDLVKIVRATHSDRAG